MSHFRKDIINSVKKRFNHSHHSTEEITSTHADQTPTTKDREMGEQQQSLNELLKWSIEHSTSSQNGTSTDQPRDASKGLNAEALAQLLGGPSDADRMRGAMAAIVAPLDQVDLENKTIAWDNLEQLIEQIDNANNMESLGLWAPLIQQLDSDEAEMRSWAAWCLSTAVQNNVKCQEKLLEKGAISRLARLATEDPVQAVRKKAVTALSSEVRNFQPGLDELHKYVPKELWAGRNGVDAGDMEAVDEVIQKLRDHAAR
jgi:hypothetical protein